MGMLVFSAGKSSVLLDIKPWDDETDMKKLEEAVRAVQMEGLLWGACMFSSSLIMHRTMVIITFSVFYVY